MKSEGTKWKEVDASVLQRFRNKGFGFLFCEGLVWDGEVEGTGTRLKFRKRESHLVIPSEV